MPVPSGGGAIYETRPTPRSPARSELSIDGNLSDLEQENSAHRQELQGAFTSFSSPTPLPELAAAQNLKGAWRSTEGLTDPPQVYMQGRWPHGSLTRGSWAYLSSL